MYKNLPKQMVLQLKDLVQYQPGQVVSRTLVQNDRLSMTLFSFDQGEEISAHASGGDAMVTVLEGRGIMGLPVPPPGQKAIPWEPAHGRHARNPGQHKQG